VIAGRNAGAIMAIARMRRMANSVCRPEHPGESR
jgi:hypothetical protein